MRILLVNEYNSCGGTETQHWREYDLLLSKGHEVASLTFDGRMPVSDGPKFNIPININRFEKLLFRAFPLGPKNEIDNVLNEFQPDLVHLNNVFNAPLAIYDAICDFPCVQTIRDYSAVCPKGTCVHADYSICQGSKLDNCTNCRMTMTQVIKSLLHHRIEKSRCNAVDLFVSPSKALADVCTRNGLETECLNDPFDFSIISEMHSEIRTKSFLYYGIVAEHKGIGKLIEAFTIFAKAHPDASLTIAGMVHPEFKTAFDEAINRNKNVSYLGVLDNREMLKVVSSAYCVIVPSLWIENYPNTVLESLALKTLVIGSNRGGIPELIQNDRLVFDVTNSRSIVDCLEYVYSLSKIEYESYVTAGAERVHINNTLEKYYTRLMEVFRSALAHK